MGFGIDAYIDVRNGIRSIGGEIKPVSKPTNSTNKDNYQDQQSKEQRDKALREAKHFREILIKQIEQDAKNNKSR